MQMAFTGERYVPELRGQIYYEHLHRYMLAFAMARDLDVLDIACGEGYGAAYLAVVARSVVGVDIDIASVRHAAARYTAMNLSFRVGSCTHIPLPDNSVDLVVSFETIEHIDEQERFLSEISRVLRPDGRLIISAPNKLIYSDRTGYQNPYHVRELYFDQFRDLLSNRFAHVQVYGQRIAAGSVVHPLRGFAHGARWINPSGSDEQSGLPALPEPAYFLAVCSSDDCSSAPSIESMFIDPGDDLLRQILESEASLRAIAQGNEYEGLSSEGDTRLLPSGTTVDSNNASTSEGVPAEAQVLPAGVPGERNAHREMLVGLVSALVGSVADDADMLEVTGRAHARLGDHLNAWEELRVRGTGLQAELVTTQDRLVTADAQVAAGREQLATATEQLMLTNERLAGVEAAHATCAHVIARLESEHTGTVSELDRLRSDMAAVETQLAASREQYAAELAAQERALQSRVNAFSSALEESVERLETEEQRSAALLREHEATIGERDAALAELEAVRAGLAETRAALVDVMGSKSWILTKPIRLTMRAVRRK
jgi:SAM-dependent methyltransferase